MQQVLKYMICMRSSAFVFLVDRMFLIGTFILLYVQQPLLGLCDIK